MMVEEKIYEIAGVKCRINFDHTLREVKEIDDMVARSGGFDMTMEDTERFLEIVLKAEKPLDLLEIKESQLSEIITDYFTKKKIWTQNMVESLILSALEKSGLNQNLPDIEKVESVT